MKRMDFFHDKEDRQLLERILYALERMELTLLKIERELKPRMSGIQLAFTVPSKGALFMPVQGPVTLTTAGQTTTASINGFDQFGNPWTGAIPPVTFTVDDSTIATSAPNADGVTDLVTAVASGVANLTASVTTDEGLTLSDTETVTVAIAPPPPPVLSSIKIAFTS